MRLALPIALLACTVARADISVDARRAVARPHTPFGPACDAALARAQTRFFERAPDIHFHVRERNVVGEYHWSDMCGVFGDYSIALAPDHRDAQPWSWQTRHRVGVTRRGVKRAGGVRATFLLEADDEDDLGDWFVAAFRPAVEVCLATASQPR